MKLPLSLLQLCSVYLRYIMHIRITLNMYKYVHMYKYMPIMVIFNVHYIMLSFLTAGVWPIDPHQALPLTRWLQNGILCLVVKTTWKSTKYPPWLDTRRAFRRVQKASLPQQNTHWWGKNEPRRGRGDTDFQQGNWKLETIIFGDVLEIHVFRNSRNTLMKIYPRALTC